MEQSQGIRVGSVLGAPVLLKPSWFAILAIVTLFTAPQVQAGYPELGALAYLVAVAAAFGLLLSVFLHEVAHAVVARAVGTAPSHIALDVWGGHTAFAGELTSPGRSALVSLVGPLANAAIGGAAWLVWSASAPGSIVELLARGLCWTNLLVAGFNALPGLPLDGGRALEAVVWKVTGNRTTGTLAAGWSGRAVAVAVMLWVVVRAVNAGGGGLFGVVWLLLIAGLLWQGAGQAIQVAQWRRRAPSVTVRALQRPVLAVPATSSLEQARDAATRSGIWDVLLVGDDGRPRALIDAAAAAAVPVERAGLVQAVSVARTLADDAVVAEHLAGEDLIRRLQAAQYPEYLVLDAAGRVVGLLRADAVAASLAGR